MKRQIKGKRGSYKEAKSIQTKKLGVCLGGNHNYVYQIMFSDHRGIGEYKERRILFCTKCGDIVDLELK